MNNDSSELVLKIDTQRTNDNPYVYDDIQKLKVKQTTKSLPRKKKEKVIKKVEKPISISKLYEITHPHSHLLLLASVISVCLFYTVILKINQTFIIKKYCHSLCLGFICLLDFVINKEQFANFTISDDYDNQPTSLRENLIEENDEGYIGSSVSVGACSKYMTQKTFLYYSIALAILCFTIELFTFYLLDVTTKQYQLNSSIGFALLSFEAIMIRMHFSLNDIKIEFINFLGLLSIFSIFIFISLVHLTIPLAGVAFFIAALRVTKFFILMQLTTYNLINMNKIILWINTIDFFIGFLLTFVHLLMEDAVYGQHILFDFNNFFLFSTASFLYYINMKFFRDFDRYGISIMSLMYPVMTLFDLFINHRQIDILNFVLLIGLSAAIAISFIGDKLWEGNNFEEREIEELIKHENLHYFYHGDKREKRTKNV